MTIEEFVVEHLNEALSVPAYGDVPSPLLPRFVTVEKTGAGAVNYIPWATIDVLAWADTRADAADLCAAVEVAMGTLAEDDQISRCKLENSYNDPDLDRKKPRYRAVFSITHYL